MVLKCSCTASNRSWIARPSQIVRIGSSTIGVSASSVRRPSIRSMKYSAKTPPAIGIGEVHDGRADGLAHSAQVVRQPSHDVAGSRSPEVACVESQEVREEVVAEVVFDSSTEAVDQLTHSIAENSGNESETDHCSCERPDASRLGAPERIPSSAARSSHGVTLANADETSQRQAQERLASDMGESTVGAVEAPSWLAYRLPACSRLKAHFSAQLVRTTAPQFGG